MVTRRLPGDTLSAAAAAEQRVSLHIFKADGRQHWNVLRDNRTVGFIGRIGNARTAVRFVAVVDGCDLAPGRGFDRLSEARRAVRRREARLS